MEFTRDRRYPVMTANNASDALRGIWKRLGLVCSHKDPPDLGYCEPCFWENGIRKNKVDLKGPISRIYI